ncbi:MAG: DUF1156 domain-containing protein, partial [Candidatus Desulforudis sp.]|nr:DUF1156 domain-containing protein [Desulforudis sp.]
MAGGRPRILIEEWLPVAPLGAESQRERAASSALPPLYFLHVWWARRPLVVSRAAVLASVLPAWDPDWPGELRERFPTRGAYYAWVLERLLGIRGDPVAVRRAINAAKSTGIRFPGSAYGYPRAFTTDPDKEDIQVLKKLVRQTWSDTDIIVADPMAGGGSIPLEGLRSGFNVFASELNPVAYVVLHATVDYPAKFGESLVSDIKHYGSQWGEKVQGILAPFYPSNPGEAVLDYIWARTVTCPYTGNPVPLSPNWWLRNPKGGPESALVAMRLIPDHSTGQCRFEILRGKKARAANPSSGTLRRGVGISPWTNEAIPDDYIKAEAQAGRMGAQLYAVVIQTERGKDFRLPTERDLEAVAQAEDKLRRRLPGWELEGLVLSEEIPDGLKTTEPHRYGMRTWKDLFSPRQLLSLLTYLECYREVAEEVRRELSEDRVRAVLTYLAFVLDKGLDRNSRMARWVPQRCILANTFDRHDFSFKWSHGEMNMILPGRGGFDWALSQVLDAYRDLARLAGPAAPRLFFRPETPEPVRTRLANAADLRDVASGSVHAVVVDPPYYDNVMYGELSDFFYVWLKRTVGDLYPEAFSTLLTDKDSEAVANPARFKGLRGRRPKDLADQDYQRKMFACFREFRRILRDDGVLTVMFTHKRADAWEAVGRALIEAGFVIRSSWPIRTEFEHSLHQIKKNAAQSTILLSCRKRAVETSPAWWDDLKGRVRRVAREKAREYQAAGIGGVDLYLATYGPTLGVLSEAWPVLTGEAEPETGELRRLDPEEALRVAREEVVAFRKQSLLGREVRFDPVTDWYLV